MSIQSMGSSTRKWPLGRPSRLGRLVANTRWAAPREVARVRVVNDHKVLPNRGAVILRGSRG